MVTEALAEEFEPPYAECVERIVHPRQGESPFEPYVECYFPEMHTRFEALLAQAGWVQSVTQEEKRAHVYKIDLRLKKPLETIDWFRRTEIAGAVYVNATSGRVLTGPTPLRILTRTSELQGVTRLELEVTCILNAKACANPYDYKQIEYTLQTFAFGLEKGLYLHDVKTVDEIYQAAEKQYHEKYEQQLLQELNLQQENIVRAFYQENDQFWERVQVQHYYEDREIIEDDGTKWYTTVDRDPNAWQGTIRTVGGLLRCLDEVNHRLGEIRELEEATLKEAYALEQAIQRLSGSTDWPR
jgi:hypothetical protein